MLILFLMITLLFLTMGLDRETHGMLTQRALRGWVLWIVLFGLALWWDHSIYEQRLLEIIASTLLIFVILFGHEIKRLLAVIDLTPRSLTQSPRYSEEVNEVIIREVTSAAESLAKYKAGALIVIEQNADLTEFLRDGVEIDARLQKSLLHAIFSRNGNDFHDGAVVIRADRIWQAKAFLSMSHSISLSQEYGTRHLAAVGVTEETDAIVVVVSEERGSISVAYAGVLHQCKDRSALERWLRKLM